MYVCMYESMNVLCMKLCNNNKEEEVTNWGGTEGVGGGGRDRMM